MAARILGGKEFPLSKTTFIQDIIASFSKNADITFIEDVSTERKYTYGDIHRRASSVCAALHKIGVKHGDIVTLASRTTPEALSFMIGVWLSGAATACINPLIPIDEIQSFLKRLKSRVVYVGEGFAEKMVDATQDLDHVDVLVSPHGKAPIVDYFNWIRSTELVTSVHQPQGQQHTIAVYFTSATTGVPKGVVISDLAFKFSAHGLANVHVRDRILLLTPMYWISNALLLNLSILKGSCLILLSVTSLEQILQTIENYKVSYMFSSPPALIEMSNRKDFEKYDTSSLEMVVVGGSTLLLEQKKKISHFFGNRNILHSVYSSTEVILGTFEMKDFPMDSPRFSTIGQTMDGVTLKIIDIKSGHLLGPNQSGEICIKSPSVIRRYLDKDLTEDELDKDGFWHMGDMGYYDEKGCVYYECRLTEIMKYKCYQIAPAELEVIIEKHPDVLVSAVVGKPSPQDGDLPAAFVVLRPGSSITEQELFDFVAERVVDQKKLRGGIFFVDSLPKSTVGKVLKKDLIKMLKS